MTAFLPSPPSQYDMSWANQYTKEIEAQLSQIANNLDSLLANFTAGSVLFVGADGAFTQDNTKLFWDDTNNRLGIGTSAPGVPLDVIESTNGTRSIRMWNNNTGASAIASVQAATGTANAYVQLVSFDNSATPIGYLSSGSGITAFNYNLPVHNFCS